MSSGPEAATAGQGIPQIFPTSPQLGFALGAFAKSGGRYVAGVVGQRSEQTVNVYTDGACSGNPGPGGWGAVLRYGAYEKEIYGGEPAKTTNNRMELMAPIQALESLTRPASVRLHTDSKYVLDGITKWLPRWKRNGWQTADKKPVKNADLWQRLDAAMLRHQVQWHWVKGHAGHPDNERADQLAVRGLHEARASAAPTILHAR